MIPTPLPTGRKPKAIDEERNVSELTDKLRELASRRHMDRGLDAVDDALREAASEIDRLREALATLTASASEFHEAVMPYLSDTTFDGDGVATLHAAE